MTEFGYAGKIAKVDLSEGRVSKLVTADYADRFVGGRGIAAKIYWDEVASQVNAFSPENYLIFTNGPISGFPRLAGSRWQVCGKSPATDPEMFSYANGGGSWGAWLKFAGFDGLAITGKADRLVYLYVNDGQVDIKDASFLKGSTAIETQQILKGELGKGVKVVATGPAGENMVSFATLLGDNDSSASGGFGAVMGSKSLKAIAVAGNKRPLAANPDRLSELSDHIFQTRRGAWESYTARIGGRMRRQICWGCISGCVRLGYRASNGDEGKFSCQASMFYLKLAMKYHGKWDETIFHATRLCDKYSLNTNVMEPMIEWLTKCHEAGILSDTETGIPISKVGSYEFIETLVKKISSREGFGEILAQGTKKAAKHVGKGSEELIGETIVTKGNEDRVYDPRLYNITALLYATEPRKPIRQLHEVSWVMAQWADWIEEKENTFLSSEVLRSIANRFWGSENAADFTTYAGTALAAKHIQDRTYADECLILCDYMWPMPWNRYSDDHLGDPSLASQIFSAVTGRNLDENELNRIGERVFNLQRNIFIKEGHKGKQDDSLLDFFHAAPLDNEPHLNRNLLVSDANGNPVSRKGAILERERFEQLKDEYYSLRGWDVSTGVPIPDKLTELGLEDIPMTK